jgi:tetratricopeptide (TPR) repeat protein
MPDGPAHDWLSGTGLKIKRILFFTFSPSNNFRREILAKKSSKRNISVFIASPGDLATERNSFRIAIQQLNAGFADGANVIFEPLGWEDTLASTGRRNQGVINEEIDRCDVFILVMHRHWGQEAPDAKPYSSYTEEEFHRALERWRKDGVPEIFVFFKRVDAAQEADAGPQLEKVLAFRRQLEETRQVMYRYIDDSEQSFIDEVDRHLRAYVRGELSSVDNTRDIVVLPLLALEEVNKAKEEAARQAQLAKEARKEAEAARLQIESLQLQAAEEAASLAKEGRVEFARQKFVTLVSKTSNISILYLGYEFFYRTGDLNASLDVLERWLILSGRDNQTSDTAAAYGNLGNLYQTRGDLDRAEEMYQKSLAINEALGRKEGMANQYGNLGNLYRGRGDLDRAEEMYQKSLSIDEALGRKEGMARAYGNLGILHQTRGALDRAEEMYQKSLSTNEALGRKEGMANQYGNLGNLYRARGDLARAEEMYQKSLNIDEALGRKEGMASDYSNLGILHQTRGDLARAEEMYQKSLSIDEALGRKEGMANQYGNLGNLYRARGDLARAEEMYQKSLNIDEALGRKEGMASDYSNLGILHQTRGDLARAEEMYQKSLSIDEALGRKEGMANQYGNLGKLYRARGDLDQAEGMYQKSIELFKTLRSPNEEVVGQWLAELQSEIYMKGKNKTTKFSRRKKK